MRKRAREVYKDIRIGKFPLAQASETAPWPPVKTTAFRQAHLRIQIRRTHQAST